MPIQIQQYQFICRRLL